MGHEEKTVAVNHRDGWEMDWAFFLAMPFWYIKKAFSGMECVTAQDVATNTVLKEVDKALILLHSFMDRRAVMCIMGFCTGDLYEVDNIEPGATPLISECLSAKLAIAYYRVDFDPAKRWEGLVEKSLEYIEQSKAPAVEQYFPDLGSTPKWKIA